MIRGMPVLCAITHVRDNWSVLLAMLALLVYIVTQQMGLAVWAGNTGVLACKSSGNFCSRCGSARFDQGRRGRE